jgi:hypothetical protein
MREGSSRKVTTINNRPNPPATGNGAVALSFHIGHRRRAVPELIRYA